MINKKLIGGGYNFNLLKLIVILIVYSITITGSTYAYLYFENNQNSITGTGGCFLVDYTAQEINATALNSTTNYQEGAVSTITIGKNSNCNIYNYANIYLHTNDSITAPITMVKALRYKVLNSSTKYERNGIITVKGDTILATVPITSTSTTYKVYIWVDADISMGSYNGTTYSGYLYATSIQSSTVGGKDSTEPVLFLKKETYVEDFNNWNLSNATISDDNVLTLAETGTSASASSSYYDVDGEYWYVSFDAYTTSSSTNCSSNGGFLAGTAYYNKSMSNIKSDNGYSGNGRAMCFALNEWSNDKTWDGWSGYGKDVKYVVFKFETGNQYSQPITKIRNFKIYGQLPSSFYDIYIQKEDESSIAIIKYAKGEYDTNYFQSNGITVTDTKVRVTENGYYTFYSKDASNNESVTTIYIKNIK